MKEMPEKIYVYIPDDDIVGTASTREGFPHQFVTEEYTRTDVFIEKACDWLKENACNYASTAAYSTVVNYDEEFLVEDFKKYMEEQV